MTQEEKQQLNTLFKWFKDMQMSHTIPLPTDQALRGRLSNLSGLSGSSKSATSENQAVNEGGSASYSVLKAPDGYDERKDGAIIKHYPYYL